MPDPFGKFPSFAHHNNAMLRDFLDRFGFAYEFVSATEAYTSGIFDETLLMMLKAYDKVMDIILPTLGPERRATYSPFLPVCPRTGRVLQVPMVERHPKKGTVVYIDPETAEKVETPVTGGHVKCQWKADWALRWTALGVDYEMAGKDLIESVTLSSKICQALGGTPPEGFNYELFLDDKGEKISKSRGNGLTIDEWLRYASPESLSLFMFQKPKSAKRLYFDVIPRAVEDYLQFVAAYPGQGPREQLDNPVWHVHEGRPPAAELPVTFGLLLNLVSASNAHDKEVLWGFIRHHSPDATPQSFPLLDHLVGYAVRYYDDFVKPAKRFRAPTDAERQALTALKAALAGIKPGASAEELQGIVYETGKANGFAENLRDWFKAIYEVLLGQIARPALRRLHRALRRRGDAGADRQGIEGRAARGSVSRLAHEQPASSQATSLRSSRPSRSCVPCAPTSIPQISLMRPRSFASRARTSVARQTFASTASRVIARTGGSSTVPR